jgi:hypothetical protein
MVKPPLRFGVCALQGVAHQRDVGDTAFLKGQSARLEEALDRAQLLRFPQRFPENERAAGF